MTHVSATRSELLARRAQIALADQGLELLRQKRAALLQALMSTVDTVVTRSEALHKAAAGAARSLARANAAAGPAGVQAAALATRSRLPLDLQPANIMGVAVPIIRPQAKPAPALQRGYALAVTDVTIDEAAAAFADEVDHLLALAESELRLKRLADEIRRTTRRVNALEHVLLPRLRAEKAHIEFALAERERADHFRLKRAKKKSA